LQVNIIVAMDETRGIGYQNRLLCHLPADLLHFKKVTMGKPLIMGKNTFLSIGKPLPGRKNIVLSRTAFADVENATSFSKALALAEPSEEVFVIGGESVYQEALSIAKRIYLTFIHHTFVADRFFPPIDYQRYKVEQSGFRLQDSNNPYALTFATLVFCER
jgi:dihydrofolate reductase